MLAVRADFYGRCAAYPELSRLLGANHVLVGPMSRDELRARDRAPRAAGRPERRARAGRGAAGGRRRPAGRAAAAVHGAARALARARRAAPAARRVRAQRRRPGRRRAAGRGRVRRARSRPAGDGAHAAAAPRRRGRERRDRAPPDRARRARTASTVAEVVARLTDRRLLTVGDGAVEVAHEALLREWPRLRAWLEEDVQGRRLHRQLGDAARAWDADASRPGRALPRRAPGVRARLGGRARARAQRDRARVPRRQPARERARAAPPAPGARRRGLAARPRGDRRRWSRSTSAATRAPRRPRPRRSASARRRSPRTTSTARCCSRARAWRCDDSPQTRSNLLAALLRSPAAIGVLRGDGDPLAGLALSPDGRTLAVVDNDGTLRLVDTQRGVRWRSH